MAVGGNLCFRAVIVCFQSLHKMSPWCYMVGLTKNSFFRHQWAIKWQRLPRIKILEFLLFLAQKWPIIDLIDI